LSNVKVKRKGQVTIPVELRQKLNIEEGSLLEVEQHKDGILLKPLPPLRVGKIVSQEEQRKIIRELDALRKKWR
jgi:AbrB family looped-hinge helix DNA binding protein